MSYSRVNIEEANKHLKQLHQRVVELENQVQTQSILAEELRKNNLELQQRLKETTSEKDARISELTETLVQSESRVQQLLEASQERDAAVLKLEKKARLFYEVVEHKSSLARILQVMEELSVLQEVEDESSDDVVHEDSLRNGLEDEVSLQKEEGDSLEELSSASGSSPKLVEEGGGGGEGVPPPSPFNNTEVNHV
jgi:DNA repair exonuclease SbcCD ATPase subunit